MAATGGVEPFSAPFVAVIGPCLGGLTRVDHGAERRISFAKFEGCNDHPLSVSTKTEIRSH